MYLTLREVADTPFHIQGDAFIVKTHSPMLNTCLRLHVSPEGGELKENVPFVSFRVDIRQCDLEERDTK